MMYNLRNLTPAKRVAILAARSAALKVEQRPVREKLVQGVAFVAGHDSNEDYKEDGRRFVKFVNLL